MACLSVLFTVMSLVGPMWSTILVWFLVLAVAHIAGNCWGSRGWAAAESKFDEEAESFVSARHETRGPLPDMSATQLREATKLGRTMPLVAAGGAMLGGATGISFLLWLGFEQVGYAGIAVGGASAAVVGGLAGFMASSFVSVARGAWQEAVEAAPTPARVPQK